MPTWYDSWLNVQQRVLFQDAQLKALMMIPAADLNSAIKFRDKYFVHDVTPDALVIDENCRIVYAELPMIRIGRNKYEKIIEFNIYVKEEKTFNSEANRLVRRDIRIAERLKTLLVGKRLYNLAFQMQDEYTGATRAEGYRRYVLQVKYNTTG